MWMYVCMYISKKGKVYSEKFSQLLYCQNYGSMKSPLLLCSISPFRNAMRIRHMMHDLFYMQARIFLLWNEFNVFEPTAPMLYMPSLPCVQGKQMIGTGRMHVIKLSPLKWYNTQTTFIKGSKICVVKIELVCLYICLQV